MALRGRKPGTDLGDILHLALTVDQTGDRWVVLGAEWLSQKGSWGVGVKVWLLLDKGPAEFANR